MQKLNETVDVNYKMSYFTVVTRYTQGFISVAMKCCVTYSYTFKASKQIR